MSFSNLFVVLLSDLEFLAWLQKILLTVCFKIDSVIYEFIVIVYNLFYQIANTTIFSEDIVQTFGERIYTLLGIFMLFKVSFSFINYIINPDSFLDKEKGIGKLGLNVVLVLALLILTPTIFSEAMDIQRIILRDNAIGNLILGISNDTDSNFKSNAGQMIAYTTFSAFFHINSDAFPECDAFLSMGSDTGSCQSALSAAGVPDRYYTTFLRARNGPAIKMLFRDVSLLWNTVTTENGSYSIVNYQFIISTLVGGAMALILATFCFDIAVRSIKLGFLQLIAPIPIISRIDPKSSKDGLFSKWLKTCFKTYLDIFIRLAAIYFAVFIISIVVKNGFANDAGIFVKVFIIFGALLFAKQLPQFISDLGFKLDAKDFTINPFKKLAAVPVIGAATAAAYGGVDSLIRGNGFIHGVKTNFREADWKGDAKKNYMFNTYDHRIKKEVNQKADITKSVYEARRQSKEREENIQKGVELRSQTIQMKATDQNGHELRDASGRVIVEKGDRKTVINNIKEQAAKANGYTNYKAWKAADDKNNATDAVKVDATTTAKALFKSQEFQESFIQLAIKKQEMYNAKNIAAKAQNDHSSATAQYNQALATYGVGAKETIAAQGILDKAYDALIDANAKVGKTTSVFNITEARHKDLQKIHTKDAEIENAWDLSNKLNP